MVHYIPDIQQSKFENVSDGGTWHVDRIYGELYIGTSSVKSPEGKAGNACWRSLPITDSLHLHSPAAREGRHLSISAVREKLYLGNSGSLSCFSSKLYFFGAGVEFVKSRYLPGLGWDPLPVSWK